MHSHVHCTPMFWAQTLRGKKSFVLFFKIQLFIYLYLETKLIITFQVIILHTDTIIAF